MNSSTPRRDERSAEPNVLLLVNSLMRGGSERKAVSLANGLAAGSGRVVLAYLNLPDSLLPDVDQRVTTEYLARRGAFSVRTLRRITRLIRKHDISCVAAINLYPTLYAVAARYLHWPRPVRIVASLNSSSFADDHRTPPKMLLYRHVLRRVDAIAFGAEAQREAWCRRYRLGRPPMTTSVVYNGVDASHFDRSAVAPASLAEWPRTRQVVGTVSEFRPEKAHLQILEVLSRLVGEGIDVGAVFVGDGRERSRIEQELARLRLQDRVCLVGEKEDVRPYLACMKVFVLPSVAIETFSNAALEAMAMGCPVVASRVGGMQEMLQFGGGVTYPPGDVDSFHAMLRGLLTDEDRRQRIGRSAREAVCAHFSVDQTLREFRRQLAGTMKCRTAPELTA